MLLGHLQLNPASGLELIAPTHAADCALDPSLDLVRAQATLVFYLKFLTGESLDYVRPVLEAFAYENPSGLSEAYKGVLGEEVGLRALCEKVGVNGRAPDFGPRIGSVEVSFDKDDPVEAGG